jgi:hypothetical protein
MSPIEMLRIRPGDVLHYAGCGYECDMAVEAVTFSRDARGNVNADVCLRRVGDDAAHLFMLIHAGNLGAFRPVTTAAQPAAALIEGGSPS